VGWRDEDDERREFAGVGLTVIGSIFNETVRPVVLLRFADPDVARRAAEALGDAGWDVDRESMFIRIGTPRNAR
jgi:hypothetical protein